MKIITTLFAIILHCFCFSQEWSSIQKNESISIDFSKVTFDSSSDGIKHERIIFQYTNLTNSDLTISFQRSVSYDESKELKLQEKTYKLTIPANSSISYNDENANDKTFYIFAKDTKGTIKQSLSNFEIVNIQTF